MGNEDVFQDLVIFECGKEKCSVFKNVSYTPRNYHIIHYVISGKGTYSIDGNTYHLHEGDLFYIPPLTTVNYYPDKEDPWTYTWVGIGGKAADYFVSHMELDEKNPIFKNSDSRVITYFRGLVDSFVKFGCYEYTSYGNVYLLLSLLMDLKKQPSMLSTRERIVLEAKEYIKHNFRYSITMTDVADNIGIKSSYMSKAFIDTLGYSPKKYLTELKMNYACDLLKNSKYNIKAIAKMVGFDDQLHFSNEFKKNIGTSPINYRNNFKESKND